MILNKTLVVVSKEIAVLLIKSFLGVSQLYKI